MDIYSRCTTTEFKTDISQLCDNCPLKIQIPKAIQEKIVFQAREHYSIDPETILDYLQSEIKKAHNSMSQMLIESKNDGAFLDKVSEIYIWNKERIKALNDFKKEIENKENSSSLNMENNAQQVANTKYLPRELDTEKAQIILKKAVEAGFCKQDGDGYKWNESNPQLALFAEIAAEMLKLKNKWKPFEMLFGKKYLAQERRKSKEEIGTVRGGERIEAFFDDIM